MRLAIFIIIWFLGGLLTGISSFGGNLFAMPLATMIYSPKTAIVTGCMAGAAICLGLACAYYRHILWKDVIIMDIGSLAGIPPGVWFLQHASERALLLGSAIVIALFLIMKKTLKSSGASNRRKSAWIALPFGFLSGLMTASLSITGLAMGMYAFLINMPKDNTLATLNTAGAFILLAGLPLQYRAGLLPPDIAGVGLIGAAAAFAGTIASVPLMKHMNQEVFSKVMLATLGASVVILTARGLL